jgi:peptidoglycan/xylan/chitin deacetylase (PgdA/CDA1 family)
VNQDSILGVTVDIEDWYHVPTVTGSPFARHRTVDDFFRDWTTRYDYLTDPTLETLELLERLGVTATFFVVADIVDHYPGLVEKIAECGHEIACHGLHHACIIDPATKEPLLDRAGFEEVVWRAKEKLEDTVGDEVVGFRAPNAFIAGWMLDALEEMGFKYDSSVVVNSIYSKMPSKPVGVTTVPYHPKQGGLDKGEARGILEIPWPHWRVLGLKLPTAGGPFLRFLGARYIAQGLGQSLQAGHTVFYFHPLDICVDAFPNEFSGRRPFYWSIKGERVKRRVERVLEQFQGRLGTCRDILVSTEAETALGAQFDG